MIRPTRSAPIAFLLAAALVVGACTDAGELGGPALGGTLAAKVGDASVTAGDLESEVEAWAANPEFLRAIGVTELGEAGRRSSVLVTFVLSHRIISEQARILSEEAGIVPTSAEVEQIIASVDANFTLPGAGGSLFAVFTEDFRRQIGWDLAFQNNLQALLAAGVSAPPVEVNPRYGDIDLLQGGLAQVAPPGGPLPAPVPADS